MNHKRVERIWRREGLKVPAKQPKRGRLWLNDGSCIRLRPASRNHVWAYDFVQARTHDGKAFRMLTVIDEFTRECHAIEVARRLRHDDVLACLTALFARPARSYPFRQRKRVYGLRGQGLVAARRREDTVYRTRFTVGKRLQRVF